MGIFVIPAPQGDKYLDEIHKTNFSGTNYRESSFIEREPSNRLQDIELESLILAQNERWRRA